jgi:hypothetical protein
MALDESAGIAVRFEFVGAEAYDHMLPRVPHPKGIGASRE